MRKKANSFRQFITATFLSLLFSLYFLPAYALDIEGETDVCSDDCILYKVQDGNGGPYSWTVDKGYPSFFVGEQITICWKGNQNGSIKINDAKDGQQINKTISIYEPPNTQLNLEDNPIACSSFIDCGGFMECEGSDSLYLFALNDCVTTYQSSTLTIDFLSNDFFPLFLPNGELVGIDIILGPQNGTYTYDIINPAIDGTLIYTSDPGFCGMDEIVYSIKIQDCYVTGTIYISVSCEDGTKRIACTRLCQSL